MNNSSKKKNEKPSSNFEEPISDKGNKAVKKPEDKDYTQDDPDFKDPARQREREEQPVDPIKKAPAKD
jgi:hypothetical protein